MQRLFEGGGNSRDRKCCTINSFIIHKPLDIHPISYYNILLLYEGMKYSD
jgi:hypothetical protein